MRGGIVPTYVVPTTDKLKYRTPIFVSIEKEREDNFSSGIFSVPGCYSLPTDMDKGYPEFGYYLNATGRPMVYACSWPVYQTYSGMTVSHVY